MQKERYSSLFLRNISLSYKFYSVICIITGVQQRAVKKKTVYNNTHILFAFMCESPFYLWKYTTKRITESAARCGDNKKWRVVLSSSI